MRHPVYNQYLRDLLIPEDNGENNDEPKSNNGTGYEEHIYTISEGKVVDSRSFSFFKN